MNPEEESVSDADGNTYKTVMIGSQIWMIENLKTTRFNDGTLIRRDTDSYSWGTLIIPAYCWYNNDSIIYKNSYGALYNGYAATSDKLCPVGWHVPTQDDWKTLGVSLGLPAGESDSLGLRGTNQGNQMKSEAALGWNLQPGTNSSGFSAVAAGYRHQTMGSYIGPKSIQPFGLQAMSRMKKAFLMDIYGYDN